MELLPYIDIIEPDRITALLTDSANFNWRAIDSETLDGFVPDLGLTNYVYPSIYRPPSIAASGLPSQVRHRFWGTVEKQSDHTGWRYIGVVIYAALGQACPMEFRLGADVIGRIEPRRFDNRRHLLVLDRPIRFIGEMEVLQLVAPGKGVYRIEHFVLLKERPQPSTFAPYIGQLTVHWTQPSADQSTATLHWTTAQVAHCRVMANGAGDQGTAPILAETTAGRLHTVHLPNLRSGTPYDFQITATEPLGEGATATITAAPPPPVKTAPLTVPMEVLAPTNTLQPSLPVTMGVPVAKGQLFRLDHCTIQTVQQTVAAQGRTLAYWPDGSVRWLLVDGALPLVATGPTALTVTVNGATSGDLLPGALSWHEDDAVISIASRQLRVTLIKSGRGLPLRIERLMGANTDERLIDLASQRDGGLACELGNGVQLYPDLIQAAKLEETGPLRTVIYWQSDWTDEQGVAHLRSTLRLHIYADQPFVKLVHRLTVISPALGAAATGHNVNAQSAPALNGAILGAVGEERTLLKVRSLTCHLPWPAISTAHCDDAPVPLAAGSAWQLLQVDDQHYQTGDKQAQQPHTGQAQGHLLVTGQPGTLAVAVRNFWQTYPKGLTVTPEQVVVELLPPQPSEPNTIDEDAWHRIHFWRRDGSYLLKAGMALTNELLLAFPTDQEMMAPIFAWFEQPPLPRPTLVALNTTGALIPLGAKSNDTLARYETLVAEAIDAFAVDRAATNAYGQVNFGDWYGESGWSWGNNEYDTAFYAYAEFLRGGDPRWAVLAAEAARHLADVDTCNHSTDPSQIGLQYMHMAGHAGGYLPPYFRSKMAGSTALPSHTWVEGPALHYLMTGDEFAHDSLRLTAQWLLQKRWFDAYDAANCREAGWHLTHLCMLARLGGDATALNAATLLVERVLEKQEPGGGWVHMLTESHCGCGYPRCRGEAGFMVVVLIGGLRRYYDLTGDPRVAQAIVGGVHWLIRHTYDAASGHFRYTSCPNRTLGGTFQHTQWVLVALADAYDLSGDEEIGRYLRQSLDVVGRFPEGIPHSGLGKAMAMQMRYVPSLLAVLAKQ